MIEVDKNVDRALKEALKTSTKQIEVLQEKLLSVADHLKVSVTAAVESDVFKTSTARFDSALINFNKMLKR